MKRCLRRGFAVVDRGLPADFDAGEEVGFGTDRFEKAGRFETVRAEDFGVGMEGHSGAAAVGGGANLFDGAQRDSAGEALFDEFLVAGHLHDHRVRERVDDRCAHPVQTAGGLVGFAGEFAARVKGAEDHLQRGFVREFRVRVRGDTAAVVADSDGIVGVKLNLNPVGVACDRFVHGVVEDFGDHMVERPFVRAANVHAGAFAHRFQPFEDFNTVGVVVIRAFALKQVVCHTAALLLFGPIMSGPNGRGKANLV